MKTIERFIICVVLLLFAFLVFGCKDKAEAREPDVKKYETEGSFIIEYPDSVVDEPYEPIQELVKLFEQLLDQEGRLIDVVGICLDRIEKLEANEPNEPECKHAGNSLYGYSESDDVFCSGCNKAIKSEPFTSVLQHIPTWPDYIELEKDLYIDSTHKNDPNYPGILWSCEILSKGTRIYFKYKAE